MNTIQTIIDLRLALEPWRAKGSSIGFVPTMGYLHDGHLSLMQRARVECDLVVVSIFVNPLQFGPSEDFDRYPRDLEQDSGLARGAGVDFLFNPTTEDVYPERQTEVRVEVGRIARVIEGHFRPGHFVGVATVCIKLFNIVQPDRAYFGKKDAQQLAVVRNVVRGLDFPIEIIGCETVREEDGLAMSSRNSYLSPEEREAAASIPAALFAARKAFSGGERSSAKLKSLVEGKIPAKVVRLQYIEVVDPSSFDPVPEIDGPAIIAIAALVGKTRLIDNIELGGPTQEGVGVDANES